MTDVVDSLKAWIKKFKMGDDDESQSQLATLQDAVVTIEKLRDPTIPHLDANYYRDVYDFYLWVEPVKKKFWDSEKKEAVEHEAYAICAAPKYSSGYFACAYKNEADAATVMDRICDRFDVQVYRVNFTSTSNPVSYREVLRER